MRITAITRFKHGELYAILKRIGWTQSELASQTGLRIGIIGDIINLVKRPTVEQADAIQKAVGTAGEYLDVLSEWPETFEGLRRGYKREQTAEVPMDRLIDHPEVLQLAAPETSGDDGLDERMEAEISLLNPQEQSVIREIYWNNKTLGETGVKIGRTRERVRQIEAKVLRKMRHQSVINRLADDF